MSVSVNGGLPASEMTFSLDPFSTMSLELTSEGPTVSEWCLIEVDDFEFGSSWGMMDGIDMIRGRRIMANVIYTYENGNTLSMVATHPNMYEMGYYSRSLLPVQNQNELHTGFAMVNISSQDATVELRLWDRYGQLNSMQTVSLHAGQQIAQYVHNRFEGLPDGFRGFLEFTTDNEGIVAMGLLDEQGMLISVPMRHYGEISRMMH